MTLLRMTAREFVSIDRDVLEARFRLAHLYKTIGDDPDRKLDPAAPSPGDLVAWCESVVELARVLVRARRPDLVILVEYQIPNILYNRSPVRIDALVCGREPVRGDPRYLVVELKRWSEPKQVATDPELVAIDGYRKDKEHPAAQSSRYKWLAMDEIDQFAAFEVDLPAIAYLHNATTTEADWLKSLSTAKPSWVVLRDDEDQFVNFVRKTFTEEPGDYAADVLRDSRAKNDATTTLTNSADVVAGNAPFALTPLQRDGVKSIVEAGCDTAPHVIFVEGGPGTGKSVVTLQALSQLHKMGKAVRLVTASTAYREALKKSLADKGMKKLSSLLATTADLQRLDEPLDVLLFDEAQRMNQYPSRTLSSAARVNDNRSIHIVMRSARVVCFAMDVGQVVRADEQNDHRKLRKHAESAQKRKAQLYAAANGGLDVTHLQDVKKVHLHDRFRAGGTGNYEIWVERLLAPKPGPVAWVPGERFRLHVAESPQWMHGFLQERIKDGLRARMVAGFCWKWTKHGNPEGDGLASDHVHLKTEDGVWSYPWNAHKRRADAPASTRWAIDDEFGFGQMGCVFTCHGLEFDWIGVVIGPDFVWRDDHWVARRHEHKDRMTVQGVPAGQKDQKFDELVRNVYRILLTRGLRGAVLYSPDSETRQHLAGLVHGITPPDLPVA
ncbi:DNA/RNA helicase domain-containing protein [Catenulispora yoronensis]